VSRADLDSLISALASKIRNELQLWQYYVLDRAREKNGILAVPVQDIPAWTGPHVEGKSTSELADIMKSTGKIIGLGKFRGRFSVYVKPKDAASLVHAAFTDLGDSESLAQAWARVVDAINAPLYEEWRVDTETALENIKNRVAYTRLDENGPKQGEITAE
jgi:glycogen debranching enzyme